MSRAEAKKQPGYIERPLADRTIQWWESNGWYVDARARVAWQIAGLP